MARTVAIGIQDFEKIRSNDYFYVDKTDFVNGLAFDGKIVLVG